VREPRTVGEAMHQPGIIVETERGVFKLTGVINGSALARPHLLGGQWGEPTMLAADVKVLRVLESVS